MQKSLYDKRYFDTLLFEKQSHEWIRDIYVKLCFFPSRQRLTSGYGILLKHIFLFGYNHEVVLWSLQLDLIIQCTE